MKHCPLYIVVLVLCITNLFSTEKQLKKKAKQGIVHQKQGRCAHAIKLFKQVVKTKPHWYSLYNRIAKCFQQLEYDEIAMNYYRKTLRYDPNNVQATSELEKYLKFKKFQKSPKITTPQAVSQKKFFSVNEIQQMQKRLWFLRDGKLMTSLLNGRDLREYSPIIYSGVFPERGGNNGFPVLMREEKGAPNIIFYLFPDDGTMLRLSAEGYDCRAPLYLPESNEILFLARKVVIAPESSEIETKYFYEQTYSLYGIDLKEGVFKEEPRVYLKNFHTISDFEKGPGGAIYLVGQKVPEALSRVFLWKRSKDLEQISLGVGGDQSVRKSPDGTKLVSLVRGPDEKYSYVVIDLESKESFALTSIRASIIKGTWDNNSKNFIFASSNPGLKDRWETTVYKVSVPQLLVSKLFESNFLYSDFKVDETGKLLYFLSNYDNNYEVYRYNLETKSQDRLTISTSDETRLGFWTFSGI